MKFVGLCATTMRQVEVFDLASELLTKEVTSLSYAFTAVQANDAFSSCEICSVLEQSTQKEKRNYKAWNDAACELYTVKEAPTKEIEGVAAQVCQGPNEHK